MNGRTVLLGLVGLAAVLALPLFLIFYTGVISFGTAGFRGGVEQNERVEADGDRRLAVREEFRNRCASIASLQDQIENDEAAMAATDDEELKDRLEVGVVGKRNNLSRLVEEYNADAADEYSRGQFKAADLPSEIDPEEEVTCGS